jgi:hypothetical protein
MIWEYKNKPSIMYQVQEETRVVQELDENMKPKLEDLLCPKVKFSLLLLKHMNGRAIAQANSRRLPNAAARVQARVRCCGICGGQSGTEAGFLRVLWLPLQIFIPPIAPQSPSSIIWGCYNRPVVAAVPSGLSLTPLRIIKNNKIKKHMNKTFTSLCVRR